MQTPFRRVTGLITPSDRDSSSRALIDEVESFVAEELVSGSRAVRARRGQRLLGQVLRAQMAARRSLRSGGAGGGRCAEVEDELALAAAMLRATLEQWHSQRAHLLEWAIIALIALDIVVHLL